MQGPDNNAYLALMGISALFLIVGTAYVAWQSLDRFGQVIPTLGF